MSLLQFHAVSTSVTCLLDPLLCTPHNTTMAVARALQPLIGRGAFLLACIEPYHPGSLLATDGHSVLLMVTHVTDGHSMMLMVTPCTDGHSLPLMVTPCH
jgi:hypothetical protein